MERTKGTAPRATQMRGTPHGPPSPFPGEGGGGALASSYPLDERGKDDSGSRGGGRRGKGGHVGGNEGNDNADNAREKDAARSFVSFSSEKELKEPWPPPLLPLGDAMMDPDPEYYLYKQRNINMILINSLSLFITT